MMEALELGDRHLRWQRFTLEKAMIGSDWLRTVKVDMQENAFVGGYLEATGAASHKVAFHDFLAVGATSIWSI